MIASAVTVFKNMLKLFWFSEENTLFYNEYPGGTPARCKCQPLMASDLVFMTVAACDWLFYGGLLFLPIKISEEQKLSFWICLDHGYEF